MKILRRIGLGAAAADILIYILMAVLLSVFSSRAEAASIICASTTSTQNSGLFEHILPLFEKEYGISVRVIAVGTGAALEIGKRGDADIVLVHARDDELRMVREGWYTDRHDLMYNDFVIVGPSSDPAGIRGTQNAVSALKAITSHEAVFVSRGDNSGTHKKEMKLWQESALSPKGMTWYLEVGQGMAKTLRIAGEKKAYALTDRGTFLSLRDGERTGLEIVVEGDPSLYNQYGVMAVNPERHPAVHYRDAMLFIHWLVSEAGQRAIASFKDKKGNQLFIPNAGL